MMQGSRWAPPASAHSLASLASHQRVYVDGVPQPGMRAPRNPYVGAPVPYFPVVPTAQAPNQGGVGPQLSPAVSQLQIEQAAVVKALAFEHDAMLHTIGGEGEFAAAAEEWKKANLAAAAIVIQAATAHQMIASQNAAFRVQAYSQRRACDEAVATGQVPHPIVSGIGCGDSQPITNPNYGWSWPEIYQQPDPQAPPIYVPPGVINPQLPPDPNAPPPDPNAPPATSGVQIPVPIFIALLGAVVTAGYFLIKAAR